MSAGLSLSLLSRQAPPFRWLGRRVCSLTRKTKRKKEKVLSGFWQLDGTRALSGQASVSKPLSKIGKVRGTKTALG